MKDKYLLITYKCKEGFSVSEMISELQIELGEIDLVEATISKVGETVKNFGYEFDREKVIKEYVDPKKDLKEFCGKDLTEIES